MRLIESPLSCPGRSPPGGMVWLKEYGAVEVAGSVNVEVRTDPSAVPPCASEMNAPYCPPRWAGWVLSKWAVKVSVFRPAASRVWEQASALAMVQSDRTGVWLCCTMQPSVLRKSTPSNPEISARTYQRRGEYVSGNATCAVYKPSSAWKSAATPESPGYPSSRSVPSSVYISRDTFAPSTGAWPLKTATVITAESRTISSVTKQAVRIGDVRLM